MGKEAPVDQCPVSILKEVKLATSTSMGVALSRASPTASLGVHSPLMREEWLQPPRAQPDIADLESR